MYVPVILVSSLSVSKAFILFFFLFVLVRYRTYWHLSCLVVEHNFRHACERFLERALDYCTRSKLLEMLANIFSFRSEPGNSN